MGVTLTQHQNHVDLDSKGRITSIAIEYDGRMEINMNVEIRKAKMIKNKIIIFFEKDTEIKDTLFTYKGWINIKSAICYGAHGKTGARIKLIDSTFQRLKTTWDGDNDKWENYDDYIGNFYGVRRSLTYYYRGLKMRRTPKFRGQ